MGQTRQGDAMTVKTRALPENRWETGKVVPGSEATRWKPGQSGNPGGRPKTAALSNAYRQKLDSVVPSDPQGRTYAQAIADALADRALAGDIRAAQELADRAEGRARQSIEIENKTLRDAFERMNREELDAYARDGKLPPWFPREAGENERIQ
jgi:hypothetical protein